MIRAFVDFTFNAIAFLMLSPKVSGSRIVVAYRSRFNPSGASDQIAWIELLSCLHLGFVSSLWVFCTDLINKSDREWPFRLKC